MREIDAATCSYVSGQLALNCQQVVRRAAPLLAFALDPINRHGRHSVIEFCRQQQLHPSTYVSQWFRTVANCAPKATLARIWCVRVYALLARGYRAADVADYLGFSSWQAMDRSIRTTLGVARGEWSQRSTLDREITRLLRYLRPLSLAGISVQDTSSAPTPYSRSA